MFIVSSGKLALPEIEKDLQEDVMVENAFKTFGQERLESNPPKVKFNDPMKKLKLKAFADLFTKLKISRAAGKEVIIKADRIVFSNFHCRRE